MYVGCGRTLSRVPYEITILIIINYFLLSLLLFLRLMDHNWLDGLILNVDTTVYTLDAP